MRVCVRVLARYTYAVMALCNDSLDMARSILWGDHKLMSDLDILSLSQVELWSSGHKLAKLIIEKNLNCDSYNVLL